MDTIALLDEVKRVFPPVRKPEGLELSFHKDECYHCQYLRRDLEPYRDPELPANAIRTMHQEMSCLSAAGWRWVLPSYLKHCLAAENERHHDETEFLIYNLGPTAEYEEETRTRLSALDHEQLGCLIHFLEWCAEHERWSEYAGSNVERALQFMRRVA